jgi:Transposase DDE domain
MVEDDLGGFGDARLRRVGERLLTAMRQQPTMCVHALAADRNEAMAFGRFLDHDGVSHGEMLVSAGRVTGQRAAGRHVLAIQDTTELNFPAHNASKRGFGRSGNGQDIGLFIHPTIAVDARSGGMIGLVGAQLINRTGGKLSDHKRRPIEAKESHRWLAATGEAGEVLAAADMITVVADRESDVYDQFACRPPGVHLLSRSAQDRALTSGRLLSEAIAAWPEQHRELTAVPEVAGRPGRDAWVALRFGAVALRRPAAADRRLAASVDLHVVDVIEIEPPADAIALHWRLLTTHPVGTLAEARQIIAWYRTRWTIEQVFRTLKSAALQVEQSQVVEARRFMKLAVVALIAAVRIVQIVLGRDGRTGQSMADVIDPATTPALQAVNRKMEGRTDKLKNPHAPESLAWLAWIVARLGGWSGYTSSGYKPPGPKTIARGLIRLDGLIDGWNMAIHSVDV